MRAERFDRSRDDQQVHAVGNFRRLRKQEFIDVVAFAFESFFDEPEAGWVFYIVGIRFAVPIKEGDRLFGFLGRANDRVGQRFFVELGDVGSFAIVAAVL